MKKVTPISRRKADHININLRKDVQSTITNGLELYRFVHHALPELDLASINTSLKLFGKTLAVPILSSSMTGGTREAKAINMRLAEAAQEIGFAMGVGSQRAALENPALIDTYSTVRRFAPEILLFANLGAVQLNYGYTIAECQRAVDMIQADALILHLNPLQEAIQIGGDTNFSGLAQKIHTICKKIQTPVIIKEVGWGISRRTAMMLADCGVSAIDVAGAGGTSWSQVEMYRTSDMFTQQLATPFIDWGVTTAKSILNIKSVLPGMVIFASGGLKTGVDVAKCIALGASLGGFAGEFLKAAAISTKKVIEFSRLVQQQLKVVMFSSGIPDLEKLRSSTIDSDGQINGPE